MFVFRSIRLITSKQPVFLFKSSEFSVFDSILFKGELKKIVLVENIQIIYKFSMMRFVCWINNIKTPNLRRFIINVIEIKVFRCKYLTKKKNHMKVSSLLSLCYFLKRKFWNVILCLLVQNLRCNFKCNHLIYKYYWPFS